MFGGDRAQRLTLEVGELRLEFEHALRRIIPALLEGTGNQPIVRVYRLIAPFRQIGVIASALDPPPPLRTNGLIALFETGQRLKSELDRQRCNGGDDAIGNGAVERLRSDSHAGAC